MPTYKIIETEDVTAAELEQIVNEWVSQGWDFDGFQFVTPEVNRRPTLAFIIFSMDSDLEPDFDRNGENEDEESMTN